MKWEELYQIKPMLSQEQSLFFNFHQNFQASRKVAGDYQYKKSAPL